MTQLSNPQFNPLILAISEEFVGLKEYPGSKHNDQIIQMFANVGHSWVEDDETPWCAAFVGDILSRCGIQHTGKLNARSYLDWGEKVPSGEEQAGDIAVFSRGDPNGPYGHVAVFLRFHGSRVLVRGGNQGNAVSEAWYPIGRLLQIRRATTTQAAAGTEREWPTVRRGDKGIFVQNLQEALTQAGYAPGPIDGSFGQLTFKAVAHMQELNGLRVDGVVGPKTWKKIRSDSFVGPELRTHVTEQSLREDGSTIVLGADEGEKRIKQGAATTGTLGTLDTGIKAAEKIQESESLLQGLQATVMENALIIGIIVVSFVAWKWGPQIMAQIRGSRVRDAVTLKNVSR